MLLKLLIITGMIFASNSYAADYSHSTITNNRSSFESYNYFSQSMEGSFGSISFDKLSENEETKDWKGFALRSEVGTEILRFFKLSTGFAKTDYFKSGDSSSVMDRYTGFAEFKIFFSAPIFNVELGVGGTASIMDALKDNESASYTGSGTYFTASGVRFISSKMAIFTRLAMNKEHLVKDSGSLEYSKIDIDNKSIGFGISLFM